MDFRGLKEAREPYVDYYKNSVDATNAQRQFFIDVLSKEFPQYSANMWGLTASDSEKGYLAWGAPPRDPNIDGTVVPCAPAGSLMFTPEISLAALREMKSRFGDKIYGRYGFTDAFNPHDSVCQLRRIGAFFVRQRSLIMGITQVSKACFGSLGPRAGSKYKRARNLEHWNTRSQLL